MNLHDLQLHQSHIHLGLQSERSRIQGLRYMGKRDCKLSHTKMQQIWQTMAGVGIHLQGINGPHLILNEVLFGSSTFLAIQLRHLQAHFMTRVAPYQVSHSLCHSCICDMQNLGPNVTATQSSQAWKKVLSFKRFVHVILFIEADFTSEIMMQCKIQCHLQMAIPLMYSVLVHPSGQVLQLWGHLYWEPSIFAM